MQSKQPGGGQSGLSVNIELQLSPFLIIKVLFAHNSRALKVLAIHLFIQAEIG